MLKNQSVQIYLLKTTTTAKKRNTDWAFLMVANPEAMDEKVHAWYAAHRDIILNQLTEGSIHWRSYVEVRGATAPSF
jgi:hypothetical protein